MTDFLTRLAERSVGVGEVVSPRPVSVFEPRGTDAAAPLAEEWIEVDAEPPVPGPERRPARTHQPSAAPVAEAGAPSLTDAGRRAPEPKGVPERPRAPSAEREPATPPPSTEPVVELPVPAELPEAHAVDPEPAAPAPPPAAADPVLKAGPPTVSKAPPAPERALAPERAPESAGFLRPPEPGSLPSLRPSFPGTAPPAEASHEPPIVHVTIGRVEVRAVVADTPAERPAPRRRPRMTLDEYLRKDGRS